ncbi:phage antirepressor [Megasphaera stantonii]|uniref:phage antirepressor n=1 Tax=Megasphaera stantonii TaxID=2144175 RepID=UPI00320919C0
MNNVQTFKNTEFGKFRAVVINTEPWFVGKDVASILGYADTFGALKKHVDLEDKQNCQNDSFESPRGLTVINESGLYSLVLSSKLPTAKKFKRWVTSEVLPTIRKHGAYMTEDALHKAITEPDFLIRLATELKQEKEARQQAEQQIEADRPKVLFAGAVSASHTSILIGDLAKLLKQNGYETGQKRLFQQLRDEGYLIKSGSSKNMPTQKAMEKGLFEVKETTINNPDGTIRVTKTPKVTGKGQVYFINRYLGDRAEKMC